MTDRSPVDAQRELLLRVQLVARDGLVGDRLEVERLTGEVFGKAPQPAPPPPDVFRETDAGGRWCRRRIAVGDRIGTSTVRRQVGVFDGQTVFEVDCAGCGATQLRGAAQLNHALRWGREVSCPTCLTETNRGRRYARAADRVDRVRDGGPVYTSWEIEQLCEQVRADLVEAFGVAETDDDRMQLADMVSATGWPYSRAETQAVVEQAAARREGEVARDKARLDAIANKQWAGDAAIAADVLRAVESGDADKIYAALARSYAYDKQRERDWLAEYRAQHPEPVVESDERVDRRRSARCKWCGQRFAWRRGDKPESCCTDRCAKRYEAFEELSADRKVALTRAKLEGKRKPPPPLAPVYRKARCGLCGDDKYIISREREDHVFVYRCVHCAQRKDCWDDGPWRAPNAPLFGPCPVPAPVPIQSPPPSTKLPVKIEPEAQYVILMRTDELDRIIGSLQRQLVEHHHIQASYVRAIGVRDRVVLEFTMNGHVELLHVVLNGTSPGRAAWVIGAVSAVAAVDRIANRVYSPDVGIPHS